MTENGTKYRLGLDLGTNSIGWAAVKLGGDGEPCGVLDMGVRIFPDGRNPRDGSSNAAQRRVPRGQRRRRDRYLKRRGDLMEALIECGLMPQEEVDRKNLEGLDPYKLRARALDDPLAAYELGRALFHLDQRRGFKSNRKAGGEDESEAQKTRVEINALRKRIEDSGAGTLGEFLARRHERSETVRARPGHNLYPDRAMYETEFDAIRTAQEQHQALSDRQWDSLKQTIFFQRPLKAVDPGRCQLEEGEERAARALPVAQEFRMLQEVNNLRVRVGSEPDLKLNGEERKRVLNRLRAGKDLSLERPTRDIELPSGAAFNLARGGRKSVEGDVTAKRLMTRKKEKDEKKALELFGRRWPDLSLDERNEIVKFMLDTEEPEEVRRKAVEEWGMDEGQAEAVANVSLPEGYANLSEKAMRKLLPHLEKGLVYSDAVIAAGYEHHSDFRNVEAHERLPYYGEVLERDVVGADPEKDPETDGEPARYGRIGNPTVHIGLGQLRRVVNRLIEVHGKPQEVVVELARDLKSNKEQKDEYARQQREGGERNRRFTEMLKSAEEPVTSDVLRKLRLWEEQGPEQARVCPYTGKPLSFSMVVSSATEVDHILPFSKTLNDSMANKVVCIAAANRDKGDRSPYEAFGHSPPGYDYEEILESAAKLPDNKRWRFREDAMKRFEDESEFLDRQLNETRYLSRTARTYLAHLYDEKTEGRQRVRVIPGRMTALLRRGWGLEWMLRVDEATGEIVRKQRNDHRHHAIDAFVVANTTQGLLQRFAQAAASSVESEERLEAVAGDEEVRPWEGFSREELQPLLDRMVVSYKPDHGTRGVEGKTTGQLHNETAYGLIDLAEGGVSKVVVRKKLADMKRRADLDSVRDAAMRAALLELWDSVGGKRAEFAEKAANEGVLLKGQWQPVRRVRVVDEQRVIPIKDGAGKAYKGYLPDSNEFADVWRMPDKKKSWKMVVVPTYYANQPRFDIEKFRPHPGAKRLMRLQIDDMGAMGQGSERRIVRVRKITNARNGVFVVLDDHNEANVAARKGKDMKENNHSARQLQNFEFRKVGVDEIGRVVDPGPLEP